MSTPSKASGTASPTVRVRPPALTVFPADRPEASKRSSPTGKPRSLRIWIMVRPTTPVAPTTATVRGWACGDMRFLVYADLGRGEYSSGARLPGRRCIVLAHDAWICTWQHPGPDGPGRYSSSVFAR